MPGHHPESGPALPPYSRRACTFCSTPGRPRDSLRRPALGENQPGGTDAETEPYRHAPRSRAAARGCSPLNTMVNSSPSDIFGAIGQPMNGTPRLNGAADPGKNRLRDASISCPWHSQTTHHNPSKYTLGICHYTGPAVASSSEKLQGSARPAFGQCVTTRCSLLGRNGACAVAPCGRLCALS
jgi:hypothetical protein